MPTKKRAKRKSPPKTMRCSKCGYVTHGGIAMMGAHYRKKHPKTMRMARAAGRAAKPYKKRKR